MLQLVCQKENRSLAYVVIYNLLTCIPIHIFCHEMRLSCLPPAHASSLPYFLSSLSFPFLSPSPPTLQYFPSSLSPSPPLLPSLPPPLPSQPPPIPPSERLIPAAAFILHETHCRRHLKLCEVCNEPVPVQDMEEHMAENHAPTSCEWCGASMPRDQLEEHTVRWR